VEYYFKPEVRLELQSMLDHLASFGSAINDPAFGASRCAAKDDAPHAR